MIPEDSKMWVPVVGFEGIYEVSNTGEVRRCEGRTANTVLKTMLDRYGYQRVHLRHKDKRTTKTIHRLVAEAFLPNPFNKECVDHADNDKLNNHVDNLRWATVAENAWNAKISKRNTLKMKGVTFCEQRNKYLARICHDYRPIHLGYFNTAEEASAKYKEAALELFGEFSRYDSSTT